MSIETLYEQERERLIRRLTRMLGSRELAEDLGQEAFIRTWRRAPEHLAEGERAAWLNRVATNLAIDELRRRRRGPQFDVDAVEPPADGHDPDGVVAVREALEALTPHDRMVLLLRFELGLSHAEIGALLDLAADSARKRVERARSRFADVLRTGRRARQPVIAVAVGEYELYREWLEGAGARVRQLHPRSAAAGTLERQLANVDGLVIGAEEGDVDPALYREPRRARIDDPDRDVDRRELWLLKTALRLDLPVIGVCRGHQLLSVALGGSLFQDVDQDRVATLPHQSGAHVIETAASSLTRRLLGHRLEVPSEHHQATHRLGRGLRASMLSADGLIEGVELPGRLLTLGLQWHPERPEAGDAGRRVAEALVEAAGRRAAAANDGGTVGLR
jgi:putative glutamine amidotransferase